jgi:hypothetical protein
MFLDWIWAIFIQHSFHSSFFSLLFFPFIFLKTKNSMGPNCFFGAFPLSNIVGREYWGEKRRLLFSA